MGLFEIEKLEEKQITSENVFDGVLLHVYKDEVLLPNGNTGRREYLKHLGAVAIVALSDDGKIAVERQFRYPFQEVLTEIPAGKLDTSNEDHQQAAARELREETGITADNWTYLAPFYPSCAYSQEIIYLYLATGLHYGNRELDDDEFINVEMVPLQEVVDEIMAGKISDGKTIAAVLMADKIANK